MRGGWFVDPLKAELGPRSWDDDVLNWMARARSGVGVGGRLDSRTAYFWGESLVGRSDRRPVRTAEARRTPKDDKPPKDKPPKELAPRSRHAGRRRWRRRR